MFPESFEGQGPIKEPFDPQEGKRTAPIGPSQSAKG